MKKIFHNFVNFFKRKKNSMEIIDATCTQHLPPSLVINYFGNKQTGDWVCMPLGIFKEGKVEYLTPNFLEYTDNFLEKYLPNGEEFFTHNYYFVYNKDEVKDIIRQLQQLIKE